MGCFEDPAAPDFQSGAAVVAIQPEGDRHVDFEQHAVRSEPLEGG